MATYQPVGAIKGAAHSDEAPLLIPLEPQESRSVEQLREQYALEKMLADRLRRSSKEERRFLYSSAYDELFRRVPHHPQVLRKLDAHAQAQRVSSQIVCYSMAKPRLFSHAHG